MDTEITSEYWISTMAGVEEIVTNRIKQLAQKQAQYCRIFSDPRRLLILWVLVDRELSVSTIAGAVDSSVQNVSQHLRKMKEVNILCSRREGQTIYYRLADSMELEGCCLVDLGRRLRSDFEGKTITGSLLEGSEKEKYHVH